MERRQFILLRKFIDEVIAEQSSTFEKASELCSVGTSLHIALRVLCRSSSQSSQSSLSQLVTG